MINLEQCPVGATLPQGARLILDHVGSAEASYLGTTYSFDLAIAMDQRTPVVRCRETGKFYALSWQDILDLAGTAGITVPGVHLPYGGTHGEKEQEVSS